MATFLKAAALTAVMYVVALTLLFPRYFAPIAPFHGDFYDYAAMVSVPLRAVLHYPRPAAFFAMKMLGIWNIWGEIAGAIVITIASIALTIWLIARVTNTTGKRFFGWSAVYLLLVFAQPGFYWEHRHDLPAVLAYFWCIVAFHLWHSSNGSRRRWIWRAGAVLCCLLFAFSKETWFLAALCLAAGLSAREPDNWRPIVWLLAAVEGISLLVSKIGGSPFVSSHDAHGPYTVVLAPLTVAGTYWRYLCQTLTPGGLLFLIGVVVLLWRTRERIFALALVAAGLTAILPNAILPFHFFDEYSWIPAPFLFAPVLLMPAVRVGRRFAALCAVSIVLSLVGHYGYLHRYKSVGNRWYEEQEAIGRHLVRSWAKLKAIPDHSTVVVAGLDTPFLPFSPWFADRTFGPKKWIVVRPYGQGEPNAGDAPTQFDYAAEYDETGHLIAIQRTSGDVALCIPAIAKPAEKLEQGPLDRDHVLAALGPEVHWGADSLAWKTVFEADKAGLGGDEWVRYFKRELASRKSSEQYNLNREK